MVGWLAGAAVGCLLPGVLCLTLLLQRRSDPEFQTADALATLSWLFLMLGAPGLGGAAVGAAFGLRRRRAAAGCLPIVLALTLACWTSARQPGDGKALALLLPYAVANPGVAAFVAGKVARDRSAG